MFKEFSILSLFGVVFSIALMVLGVADVMKTTTLLEPLKAALEVNIFINLASLLIVLGGILAVVFISYPARDVFKALGKSFTLFSSPKKQDQKLLAQIDTLLSWQSMIRQNRLQALEQLTDTHADSIAGSVFSWMSTNYSEQDIRHFGEQYIQERISKRMKVIEVLKTMGNAGPAFGMFGTLFGLIVMLRSLDDPSSLGPGLAAALITTLYGLAFSRLLFIPLYSKLRGFVFNKAQLEDLTLEGLLYIQQGRSSFFIKDALLAQIGASATTELPSSANPFKDSEPVVTSGSSSSATSA